MRTRPRARLSRLVSLALACAPALTQTTCGGCDREDGASAVEALGLSSRERETLARVEALGDRAAFVVVLRPARWEALGASLSGLAAALPEALRAELAPPQSLDEWLALARAQLGERDGAVVPGEPIALKGWDPARPVVLALAEPPVVGPPGAVAAALGSAGDNIGALRHQARVPALDPSALLASLAALLDRHGARAESLTREDGDALRWSFGPSAWVALVPEADGVRIVASTHERVSEGFIGDPRSLQSRALDEPARAPARTPALLSLARDDAAVGLLVRPWSVRALGSWLGAVEVARALEYVTPDMRDRLAARGLEIILRGELLMTDEGAEVDDVALSLRVDGDALILNAVSSVSDRGAALLDAGLARRGAPPPLATEARPLAELTLTLDLDALAGAASAAAERPTESDARELTRELAECGIACTLYLPTRAPVDTLRRLAPALPRDPDVPLALPRSARAALLKLDRARPEAALAIEFSSSFDAEKLRALLERAPRELGLQLHTEARGDATLALLGLNVDPRAVFDLRGDAPREPSRELVSIGRARVELDALAAAPTVRAALPGSMSIKGLGTLTAETWRSGQVLVSELRLARDGSDASSSAPPAWVRGLGRVAWESPIRASPASPGDACLAEAARAVAEALAAQATAAPEERARMTYAALEEAEPGLRCAAEHEATRAAAASLRAAVVLPMTRALVRAWRPDEAQAALARHCEASGAETLCDRAKALARVPSVALARPRTRCPSQGGDSVDADHRVLVTGDGRVFYDEEETSVAELAARVEASLGPPPGPRPRLLDDGFGDQAEGSVALAFAETTTTAALTPVLLALAGARLREFSIVVDGDSGPRGVPIAAPLRERRALDALLDEERPGITVALDGDRIAFEGAWQAAAPTPSATPNPSLYESARTLFPDADFVVRPTAATPWRAVAEALVATCPNGQLVRDAPAMPDR
ncbi:MAG: hypothetical protein H6713_23465 [Myxococcales bacterium]|nr:hypothetical protein [Myxococcales bacterium]